MVKSKKRIRMRKSHPKAILTIVVIILVITFVFFRNHSSISTAKGVAYVRQQQDASTKNVKSSVTGKRNEEWKQAIEDEKLNVYSMFEDYVFLGDSRVMGYEVYNLLDDDRILSDSGATIKNVDDHLEEIRKLNPSTVYMSYGVNDMGLGLDASDGGYGGLYKQEVKKILKVVPNAKIVICSIVPCTPAALEKSPNWANYKKYNSQLKAMCEKNGWIYVDCTELADGGNADIYQADGIHYLTDFYPVWAKTIIDASHGDDGE